MPRVATDGIPIENAYEPPPLAKRESASQLSPEQVLLIVKSAIAAMPAPVVNVEAPVVNVPKPEVKINSPIYVQPTEVKVPATVVNVPDGKVPVVNFEPAKVTLQTNRPNKWKFTIERDELGRMTTIYAEAP